MRWVREIRLGAAALAVIVCAALPATASATPTGNCSRATSTHYDCTFWPAGDGISGGAPVVDVHGTRLGYLNGGTNWVICQQSGSEGTYGSTHNKWWAWTEANDLKYGWVNAVWAKYGANDEPYYGVPNCNGAHGSAPIAGAASPTPPPPPPATSTAPASVPCRSSGGRHYCNFYPAGDGIHGGAAVVNDQGYWVGYLNHGSNWVVCQLYGGKVSSGSDYNHYWAWTEANDRTWGWVNAVWASGGDNDGKFAGVPSCDAQRDAAPLGQFSSGPSKPKPTKPAPKPPTCPRYEIFGLRGSGEAYAGPYHMGSTVGLTAEYAVSDLPAHSTVAYSIPYPAASVGTLISDPNTFFQSMDSGEFILRADVHKLAASCPHTGIAIIGYSQGAGVASQAVRMMSSADRARITALVLFADTYSDGDTKYAYTFNPFTENQRGWKRHGHGIFGGEPIPLPANRIADVCFVVDPVCVSGGDQTISNALFAGVHTEYKSWDGGFAPHLLPLIFGHFASRALKG